MPSVKMKSLRRNIEDCFSNGTIELDHFQSQQMTALQSLDQYTVHMRSQGVLTLINLISHFVLLCVRSTWKDVQQKTNPYANFNQTRKKHAAHL